MENVKRRLEKELDNIYRYSKANAGEPPGSSNVIYGKYNVVKKVIEEVEKADYLSGSVLRRRILNAETYEEISIECAYSLRQIYREYANGKELFIKKAIELDLVK